MTPRRTAAGFLCAYLVLQTAYGQDVGVRDETGAAGAKARPVPTTEQLRAVLREATEALKKNAEAKNGGEAFPVPDFRAMQQRATEAETADALRAIGAAQAAVGDRDAAARNWQEAEDTAAEVTDPAARADALTRLAASRHDAGDRDQAFSTLQQALQAVRCIKAAAGGPGPCSTGP